MDKIGQKTFNVLVISDMTVEHFLTDMLVSKFQQVDMQVEATYLQYNEYYENDEAFKKKYDFIVIWMCLSDYENYQIYDSENEEALFQKMLFLYSDVKARQESWIIWIGFDSYADDSSYIEGNIYSKNNIKENLNKRICEAIQKNDVAINFEKLLALIGSSHAYNLKYKYAWGCIYEKIVFDYVADEIFKQYKIANGITKKCIVLDCDNVLWGGILSEDGKENIKLGNLGSGKFYREFQEYILRLYHHGVILAVASKNDIADVMDVFENHSGMVLKKEHISVFEVNWESKADNIEKISKKLNISLDSMVFIDDSTFEINLVKMVHPTVETILFEKFKIFSDIKCCNISDKYDAANVKLRNETYRTNVLREELKEQATSFEDYLKMLNTQIKIHKAQPCDYGRVVELSQRTNKGTNGKRYTSDTLKTVVSDPLYCLYIVEVADRFSDLGIVGAIGLYGEKDDISIDLFCLSCRAFGRNIENEMVKFICDYGQINTFLTYDTHKNEDFLTKIKTLVFDRHKQCVSGEPYVELDAGVKVSVEK